MRLPGNVRNGWKALIAPVDVSWLNSAMKNLITASLLVILGTAALGEPVPQTEPKRYGVIFKVTTDGVSRISDLKVDRVIDPSGSGSEQEKAERPVNITVSAAYLASAKRFLQETIQ